MASRTRRPRQADRQARSAEHWGQRRRAAEQEGPAAVLAVAMDHLRATISRLPESQRPAAATEAARIVDQLRQSIADT
ncbi:hypothetical protein [Streptomyces sp. NPDC054887]